MVYGGIADDGQDVVETSFLLRYNRGKINKGSGIYAYESPARTVDSRRT